MFITNYIYVKSYIYIYIFFFQFAAGAPSWLHPWGTIVWSGSAEVEQTTTSTLIVIAIKPFIGCERRRKKYGGDDHDGEEEEEADKMGFIFQINEHGFGTQLHEEKGQKGGPNNIDYSLSSFISCQ